MKTWKKYALATAALAAAAVAGFYAYRYFDGSVTEEIITDGVDAVTDTAEAAVETVTEVAETVAEVVTEATAK